MFSSSLLHLETLIGKKTNSTLVEDGKRGRAGQGAGEAYPAKVNSPTLLGIFLYYDPPHPCPFYPTKVLSVFPYLHNLAKPDEFNMSLFSISPCDAFYFQKLCFNPPRMLICLAVPIPISNFGHFVI